MNILLSRHLQPHVLRFITYPGSVECDSRHLCLNSKKIPPFFDTCSNNEFADAHQKYIPPPVVTIYAKDTGPILMSWSHCLFLDFDDNEKAKDRSVSRQWWTPYSLNMVFHPQLNIAFSRNHSSSSTVQQVIHNLNDEYTDQHKDPTPLSKDILMQGQPFRFSLSKT